MGLRQAVPGDGAGGGQEEVSCFWSGRCLRQTEQPVPRLGSEALRLATSPLRAALALPWVIAQSAFGRFVFGETQCKNIQPIHEWLS